MYFVYIVNRTTKSYLVYTYQKQDSVLSNECSGRFSLDDYNVR